MFDPAKFKAKIMGSKPAKKEPAKKEIHATKKDDLIFAEHKKIDSSIEKNLEQKDTGFILADNYCHGCARCSIDHYGTKKEMRFCKRDIDSKGIVKFVRIKEHHKISQCKWKSNDGFRCD